MSTSDKHIDELEGDKMPPSKAPQVYKAIVSVMAKIGKEGISKDRNNQQQGYKFRGIDDVYNALSPILSENNLVLIPTVLSENRREGQTKNGGVLFYVTLRIQYDIISAVDGSRITSVVSGEAMDSADKATNKALSAAYKYLCMQLFCIPTEADNDADRVTHEPASMVNPFMVQYSNVSDILHGVKQATNLVQLSQLYNANKDRIESDPEIKQAFSDRKTQVA